MHYKEVSDISSIENKLKHEKRFYPTAIEMESSNACVEEYVRLKPEGYILIGYSLFHHEGKMSQGLLIQSGVKLGAHKIIFSRERSYSGSLSPQTHDSEEKFEGRPILESLAYKPSEQYEALFLNHWLTNRVSNTKFHQTIMFTMLCFWFNNHWRGKY